MNELNISIINPYTGREALPVNDRNEMFVEHHCLEPIITQNIERIYSENEKGYTFRTRPCYCYQDKSYEKCSDKINDLFSYPELDEMKRCVMHGDYSMCKGICKLYDAYKSGSTSAFSNWQYLIDEYGYWAKQLYFKYNRDDAYPLYNISLNISPICNYACKTCRTEYITKETPLTDEDFDDLIKVIKNVKSVRIGCDGETFLSGIYKKILSTDLSGGDLTDIIIFTNASLANKTNLSNIHPNNLNLIREFRISIDAACEETYKIVRNEKTWPNVIENVRLIRSLGDACNFKMSTVFTISKYNVCDVEKFVGFCEWLGFDNVGFSFAKPRFHGEHEDFFIPINKQQDIIDFVNTISYSNSRECKVSLL